MRRSRRGPDALQAGAQAAGARRTGDHPPRTAARRVGADLAPPQAAAAEGGCAAEGAGGAGDWLRGGKY